MGTGGGCSWEQEKRKQPLEAETLNWEYQASSASETCKEGMSAKKKLARVVGNCEIVKEVSLWQEIKVNLQLGGETNKQTKTSIILSKTQETYSLFLLFLRRDYRQLPMGFVGCILNVMQHAQSNSTQVTHSLKDK